MIQPALELAEEYGLIEWVKALLDPTDIVQSPSSAKKQITAPPKYDMALDKVKLPPPDRAPANRGSTRLRSASPSKIASPTKQSKASPRKRQTKAQKEAAIANANAASASLQSALDDAVSNVGGESSSSVVESQQNTPATSSPSLGDVKVKVDQDVEVRGDTEVTHTNVTIEMPQGSPKPGVPQDIESTIGAAKEIVEKVVQLETAPKVSKKRKFDDVEPSDLDSELPQQAAKRARVLEEGLKREKVRNRALFGVAATLTVA